LSPGQQRGILDDLQGLARDQDQLKQRGLYADIDHGGRVRLPSEVTEADVAAQLGRARQAVSAASVLLHPGAPDWLAHRSAEVAEWCRALVSAFAEADGRTARAAAEVVLCAVSKLHEHAAAPAAGPQPAS
jgi:hypothetical protein